MSIQFIQQKRKQMTQEEKQLLLKDLCARLPYGVKLHIPSFSDTPQRLQQISDYETVKINDYVSPIVIDGVKPYLRPMSSMTEEEFLEYHDIKYNKVTYRNNYKRIDVGKFHNVGIIPIEDYLDWLNAHHFDYRGLIEKGLALEAPEGMYKTE